MGLKHKRAKNVCKFPSTLIRYIKSERLTAQNTIIMHMQNGTLLSNYTETTMTMNTCLHGQELDWPVPQFDVQLQHTAGGYSSCPSHQTPTPQHAFWIYTMPENKDILSISYRYLNNYLCGCINGCMIKSFYKSLFISFSWVVAAMDHNMDSTHAEHPTQVGLCHIQPPHSDWSSAGTSHDPLSSPE